MGKALAELREDIIKSRGLIRKRYKRVQPGHVVTRYNGYTASMALAEAVLGADLREFIFSHSESECAKLLMVDISTISRWRKKLGR